MDDTHAKDLIEELSDAKDALRDIGDHLEQQNSILWKIAVKMGAIDEAEVAERHAKGLPGI